MDIRRIIHPRMLTTLGAVFFPQECDIQQPTAVQDDHGQPIESWAAVPGMINVPCRIAPSSTPSGREIKAEEMTYVIGTHDIALQGRYAGINETMRVVCDGLTYGILLVREDSERLITWLRAEIVT